MTDAVFQALHHLARALIVSGALSDDDVAEVAIRVEADALDVPVERRDDFAWVAHMLRCAIIEAGGVLPEPPTPPTLPLRIVDSGKDS
jgi:hypothetical protein